MTSKGIRLDLEVEEIGLGENSIPYDVRKDAGDDPNVADRLIVYPQIRLPDADSSGAGCAGGNYVYEKDGLRLYLFGGVGAGIVTQCGLNYEVGKAVTNPVPRKMISEQVAGVCQESSFRGVLSIGIRMPGALEVAHRTFNNRSGIRGGISILGTNGVAESMGEAALPNTIRLELRQRVRKGEKDLSVMPGSYGESFVDNVPGFDLGQTVKCSNFIDSAIDMAVEEGVESILFVGHGGKLIKLAAGIMNTHSSWADGRMEILVAHGAACDAKGELMGQTLEAVTMDEGLRLLETEDGLRKQVMRRMMGWLEQHVKRRAGEGLRAETTVLTNECGVLGVTTGADDLLMYSADRMRNR